jgi:hypothetical protein
MPYHLADLITIPQQTGVHTQENEDTRRIEALEVDNFKLRDQITRLTLHNSTLRRMLKVEGRPTFLKC